MKAQLIRCVEKGMQLEIVREVSRALRDGGGYLMARQWIRHFKADLAQKQSA